MSTPGSQQDPLGHLSSDERESFLRFLVLIRENYKKADKAAYFLERRAGVTNTCAITNLRDVLSHMATLLDPATPPSRRTEQIANAEEHLRRAILEPYEIGLGELTSKFLKVYEKYRERLLPVKEVVDGFDSAPNRVHVESRLAEIYELAETGKLAKGRNLWDDQWEEGVAALAEAYDKLSELHNEIDDWVLKHSQHSASGLQVLLGRWGIVLCIVGIVVSAAVSYYLTKYGPSLLNP
jgi:hypothetical protein